MIRSKPKILQRVGANHENIKKMVTYYNEKDLVSFGKYLLNPERAKRFHARYQEELKEGNNPVPPEELIPLVHHADLENWRHEQKQLKIKKEIARSIKG